MGCTLNVQFNRGSEGFFVHVFCTPPVPNSGAVLGVFAGIREGGLGHTRSQSSTERTANPGKPFRGESSGSTDPPKPLQQAGMFPKHFRHVGANAPGTAFGEFGRQEMPVLAQVFIRCL